MKIIITPVRLLIAVGVFGAIWHFWPSHDQTASPSEKPATANHETTKPKAAVVAKLEGHASFNQNAPARLENKPEIPK